jgi:hypothetical protein
MSMFQVTGQVVHVFDAPDVTDKGTGEITKGKAKVQLMGDIPLPNGQKRLDMITLSIEAKGEFEALRGCYVAVPLGMFSPSKGQIAYFIPRGSRPVQLGKA